MSWFITMVKFWFIWTLVTLSLVFVSGITIKIVSGAGIEVILIVSLSIAFAVSGGFIWFKIYYQKDTASIEERIQNAGFER
jgi:hypothetical protein